MITIFPDFWVDSFDTLTGFLPGIYVSIWADGSRHVYRAMSGTGTYPGPNENSGRCGATLRDWLQLRRLPMVRVCNAGRCPIMPFLLT